MLATTALQIASATGGKLLGRGDISITEISTDSRTIQPGDLFVPLKGDNFDGHNYIDMALEKGAAAALCARLPEMIREDKTYLLVSDTKRALRDLASWYRGQFNIPIVQITGTMGKTTLKEMLATVLAQKYNTLKTPGNFNGDIGAPLTLLSLTSEHQAAVVETGMDAAGQIRWLGEAVRPDIAIITNIGDVHIWNFDNSREKVLQAKAEIFENLCPGGLAVLSGDDELLNTLHLEFETVRCGLAEGCSVQVVDLQERGMDGVDCTVVTARDRYPLSIPVPGAHMAGLASICVAAAERLGLTKEEIARGIAAYTPADNRLRVERLPGGRIMINDSYNANPKSVQADLAILALHTTGRRIAMLGDMTELGAFEEEGHRAVGECVGRLGIDVLLAVGERSRKWIVPAAEEAGCPDVRWYESRDAVKDDLLALYGPGDALLVKASHFICRFDLMTDFLRTYPF